MTAPIIGCGNEPTPEGEYIGWNDVRLRLRRRLSTGFYCDANSEAGAKHTPVISAMSNNDDSYRDNLVPHVVGTQITISWLPSRWIHP